MQPPDFWYNQRGSTLSVLLAPAGWVYGLAGAIRQDRTQPWQAPVPVICVGNLVTGGQGKTPTSLSIGAALKTSGQNIHFLLQFLQPFTGFAFQELTRFLDSFTVFLWSGFVVAGKDFGPGVIVEAVASVGQFARPGITKQNAVALAHFQQGCPQHAGMSEGTEVA